MLVKVHFYSYFKELTACSETAVELPPGSNVQDLLDALSAKYPRLAPMRRCALAAVGVDYQDRTYVLKDADEVSFFPPVQGG